MTGDSPQVLRMRRAWDSFAEAQSSFAGSPRRTRLANSIRNSYVAAYEVGEPKPRKLDILRAMGSIAKATLATLVSVPSFSVRADVVIFAINERRDRVFSERTSFPLTGLRNQLAFRPLTPGTWWDIVRVCWALATAATIEADRLFVLFASLIRYAWISERLAADGIQVLLTQRDRYADELGVIDSIRRHGGITCRFDDFPIVGYLNQNRVNCDVYLAGNAIARDIFRSFRQNADIGMFVTGFPIWDRLADHRQAQTADPRIVTFFSQYGSEQGLFGRFGVKYYISEVLDCLPPGYVLHIRAHPLECEGVHSEFAVRGAVLLPKSEPVEIVYQRSAVCISVFSFSSYEAKHVCPRSCHINYDAEGVPDASYSFFSDTLDLITSRSQLRDFLDERLTPRPTAAFLAAFNPGYPESSQSVSAVVTALTAEGGGLQQARRRQEGLSETFR